MVEFSSQIVMGVAPLGNPLKLPQCLGLTLICDGELGVPLESQQGNLASSPVEVGNSGFLSSFSGKLRIPLELSWGNSGFISSCNRVVRSPFELRRGIWVSSQVAAGESGLLSSCEGELRVPL